MASRGGSLDSTAPLGEAPLTADGLSAATAVDEVSQRKFSASLSSAAQLSDAPLVAATSRASSLHSTALLEAAASRSGSLNSTAALGEAPLTAEGWTASRAGTPTLRERGSSAGTSETHHDGSARADAAEAMHSDESSLADGGDAAAAAMRSNESSRGHSNESSRGHSATAEASRYTAEASGSSRSGSLNSREALGEAGLTSAGWAASAAGARGSDSHRGADGAAEAHRGSGAASGYGTDSVGDRQCSSSAGASMHREAGHRASDTNAGAFICSEVDAGEARRSASDTDADASTRSEVDVSETGRGSSADASMHSEPACIAADAGAASAEVSLVDVAPAACEPSLVDLAAAGDGAGLADTAAIADQAQDSLVGIAAPGESLAAMASSSTSVAVEEESLLSEHSEGREQHHSVCPEASDDSAGLEGDSAELEGDSALLTCELSSFNGTTQTLTDQLTGNVAEQAAALGFVVQQTAPGTAEQTAAAEAQSACLGGFDSAALEADHEASQPSSQHSGSNISQHSGGNSSQDSRKTLSACLDGPASGTSQACDQDQGPLSTAAECSTARPTADPSGTTATFPPTGSRAAELLGAASDELVEDHESEGTPAASAQTSEVLASSSGQLAREQALSDDEDSDDHEEPSQYSTMQLTRELSDGGHTFLPSAGGSGVHAQPPAEHSTMQLTAELSGYSTAQLTGALSGLTGAGDSMDSDTGMLGPAMPAGAVQESAGLPLFSLAGMRQGSQFNSRAASAAVEMETTQELVRATGSDLWKQQQIEAGTSASVVPTAVEMGTTQDLARDHGGSPWKQQQAKAAVSAAVNGSPLRATHSSQGGVMKGDSTDAVTSASHRGSSQAVNGLDLSGASTPVSQQSRRLAVDGASWGSGEADDDSALSQQGNSPCLDFADPVGHSKAASQQGGSQASESAVGVHGGSASVKEASSLDVGRPEQVAAAALPSDGGSAVLQRGSRPDRGSPERDSRWPPASERDNSWPPASERGSLARNGFESVDGASAVTQGSSSPGQDGSSAAVSEQSSLASHASDSVAGASAMSHHDSHCTGGSDRIESAAVSEGGTLGSGASDSVDGTSAAPQSGRSCTNDSDTAPVADVASISGNTAPVAHVATLGGKGPRRGSSSGRDKRQPVAAQSAAHVAEPEAALVDAVHVSSGAAVPPFEVGPDVLLASRALVAVGSSAEAPVGAMVATKASGHQGEDRPESSSTGPRAQQPGSDSHAGIGADLDAEGPNTKGLGADAASGTSVSREPNRSFSGSLCRVASGQAALESGRDHGGSLRHFGSGALALEQTASELNRDYGSSLGNTLVLQKTEPDVVRDASGSQHNSVAALSQMASELVMNRDDCQHHGPVSLAAQEPLHPQASSSAAANQSMPRLSVGASDVDQKYSDVDQKYSDVDLHGSPLGADWQLNRDYGSSRLDALEAGSERSTAGGITSSCNPSKDLDACEDDGEHPNSDAELVRCSARSHSVPSSVHRSASGAQLVESASTESRAGVEATSALDRSMLATMGKEQASSHVSEAGSYIQRSQVASLHGTDSLPGTSEHSSDDAERPVSESSGGRVARTSGGTAEERQALLAGIECTSSKVIRDSGSLATMARQQTDSPVLTPTCSAAELAANWAQDVGPSIAFTEAQSNWQLSQELSAPLQSSTSLFDGTGPSQAQALAADQGTCPFGVSVPVEQPLRSSAAASCTEQSSLEHGGAGALWKPALERLPDNLLKH